MAELREQIETLAKSLDDYDATAMVEWSIGKLANVLIAQAKEQVPDNAILEAIDPFNPAHSEYIANVKAGAVRALLRQVAEVLRRRAPSIA